MISAAAILDSYLNRMKELLRYLIISPLGANVLDFQFV